MRRNIEEKRLLRVCMYVWWITKEIGGQKGLGEQLVDHMDGLSVYYVHTFAACARVPRYFEAKRSPGGITERERGMDCRSGVTKETGGAGL